MVRALSLMTMKLIPHGLTPVKQVNGIRSLSGFGKLVGPLAQSVLYLHYFFITRLALKLYRGELAISGFDWSFAPTHRSSKPCSTDFGSVLHGRLSTLQPAHT